MTSGILYLVGSLKSGGTETQLVELLRRIDRRRFDPSLLLFERAGAHLAEVQALGVEIREIGFRRFLSLGTWPRLREHAAWSRRKGIRIIHGFHFHGAFYGALLKRMCPGVKLVVSESALYGPEDLRRRLGRGFYLRGADTLTANCDAVGEAVARRDRLGRERIRVIYGGVDTEKFSPPATGWVRLWEGSGPVVGCVGRLHPDKGQILLIDAAPRILASVPEARFVLVGDGPQRAEVEAAVALRGLGGSVILLGDRRDVPDLLRSMDLLVLPSISEGFSNAALEAQACGLPVVASNVGGNLETVVDGETGRIFRAQDAEALAACVVELLRAPARARSMGEAGRRRALSRFSFGERARRYEELYDELTGRRSGADPRREGATEP